MKKIILFLGISCSIVAAQIPSQYHHYENLTKAIKQLGENYSSILKIESIAKTLDNREIWLATLGKGETSNRKALLVIGGVEGTSLVGSEHALRLIQHLVQSYGKVDSITALLNTTTIFVIPRLNPDAGEAYFTKPLTERTMNSSPFDDDRDAAIDEDDVEDVNSDGVISWMRVEDPRGEWIVHPDDSRLMKKADPAKGEKGKYRLLSEGIDNDKDEVWNEDGLGGTDLNRNFTFNYQFFGKNSGIHQISENETKGLANFLFDNPNIGIVFSFSSNDNLTVAWKNEPPKGDSPHITSVLKEDEDYFASISKKFGEITKLKDAPKPDKGEGALSDWAYYHAGRWSFSVRPWWPGELPKGSDTTAVKDSTKKSSSNKKDEKEKSDDPQLKVLKWYDAVNAKDIAVEWKKFKHPDFPQNTVEIGGIKPFVLTNPPAESLNSFSKPFVQFITYLAGQLPSIALSNHKVEKMGSGIFRVSVDVVNNGFLPTNSAMGVKTRWMKNVRVLLNPSSGTEITSGKTKQVIDPIKGSGGYQTLSWLVTGKGPVKITAENPVSGKAELTVDLK